MNQEILDLIEPVKADPEKYSRLLALIDSDEDWGLRRLQRLQAEQGRFREPERTVLCDILANNALLRERGRYSRYESDWALVQVCESIKKHNLIDQLGFDSPTIGRLWQAYQIAKHWAPP